MSERVIVEQNFIDEVVIPETPSVLGTQQIFVLCSLPEITVGVIFAIDENGHLIATYSNGDVDDLGKVEGTDGVDGQDGNIVQVTEESVPLIPGSIHVEELESNHLYSFSGVAHDVTIDITLDFETGSFAEVTFIAGQNIANNGITINNAQGNVPVVIVEYGVSMQVSEWRPEYGKQVSLLFCNNGLSIVCGVTEV